MNYAASLATILFTVLLGAMSPGPSLLMVARVSMSRSRRQGIAAALGMGCGAVTLSLLAVLGMKTVFTAFPQLYQVLQIVGGALLSYVGIRIWQHARTPIAVEAAGPEGAAKSGGSFRAAFLVQISNPKTIIFFSSVFASLLPGKMPLGIAVILPVLIFIVESSWYSMVAVLLSSSGPRAAYMRAKVWIDRIAGSLIFFLGINLLVAAF